MADVTIYTTNFCPYCVQAKRLLDHKGVAYREIDVGDDPARRTEMIQASGRRSVPQVFIDGQSIGGFQELQSLEHEGRLDALLAG